MFVGSFGATSPDLVSWTHYTGLEPGRLGLVIEGGGKKRIFAIGSYVRQRLVYPFHAWLMKILKKIPMDGTFDQEKPLLRLVGSLTCFSYDLKSATDRWPLPVMGEVVEAVWGYGFGSALLRVLAGNVFIENFSSGRQKLCTFAIGQPLGMYSSWPLFALSHHVVVWYWAERVYPGRVFREYCLLGDDIVICDEKVAKVYTSVLECLQVKISYQKSVISRTGAAEFAKRFRVKGLSVDLSPISVKSLLYWFHPIGLMGLVDKYSIPFNVACRLSGAGYKTLSRIRWKLPSRLARLKLMYSLRVLPLDLWVGDGMPISPYHYGVLVQFLRSRSYIDLTPIPVEAFPSEEEYDLCEYTMIRAWVKSWLRHLQWYCLVALSSEVRIGDFFDAPIIERKWWASETDQELVRFGLIWKARERCCRMR